MLFFAIVSLILFSIAIHDSTFSRPIRIDINYAFIVINVVLILFLVFDCLLLILLVTYILAIRVNFVTEYLLSKLALLLKYGFFLLRSESVAFVLKIIYFWFNIFFLIWFCKWQFRRSVIVLKQENIILRCCFQTRLLSFGSCNHSWNLTNSICFYFVKFF